MWFSNQHKVNVLLEDVFLQQSSVASDASHIRLSDFDSSETSRHLIHFLLLLKTRHTLKEAEKICLLKEFSWLSSHWFLFFFILTQFEFIFYTNLHICLFSQMFTLGLPEVVSCTPLHLCLSQSMHSFFYTLFAHWLRFCFLNVFIGIHKFRWVSILHCANFLKQLQTHSFELFVTSLVWSVLALQLLNYSAFGFLENHHRFITN